MPIHNVTLPDIEQSAARPIIFEITKQLFSIIGLSNKTKIHYTGPTGAIQTPGTSIDNESREAQFATERYTFVEVTEEYDRNALQETYVNAVDNKPVFLDSALHVSLRPIYLTSDVTVSIKYRSPSETEVKRWLSSMYQRAAMGREINLHSVGYTYPLPLPFIGLIDDIWTLREAVAGYGESFSEYFVSNSSNRLTILGNRAGEMRHLAIKEKQSRIQGIFDFSGIPEKPIKDNDTGTWEISFAYKFSYQRPDGVLVIYPVSVHNQFLPVKYLEIHPEQEDVEERRYYQSHSYTALGRFEADTMALTALPGDAVVTLPSFDDFTAPVPFKGVATALTALCFLEGDRQVLIDLLDLGDHYLDQDLIDYLKNEAPYLNKKYQSLVNVTAYVDDAVIPETDIEVTNTLVVRSLALLNYRKQYRIRLSVVIDVRTVTWPALERLSKYPKAFVKIVAAINELLRENQDFIAISTRTHVEPWELTYVFWILSGCVKAPVSDYSYTDTINYPNFKGRAGERFIGSIDRKMVENYLALKRRLAPTVQSSAIIAMAKPVE